MAQDVRACLPEMQAVLQLSRVDWSGLQRCQCLFGLQDCVAARGSCCRWQTRRRLSFLAELAAWGRPDSAKMAGAGQVRPCKENLELTAVRSLLGAANAGCICLEQAGRHSQERHAGQSPTWRS